MLDSATTTFDPARTKAYARRAFETIIEDAPGIWLYETPAVMGLHKRIHTTTMRADGYWSGIADWWIPASQRSGRDRWLGRILLVLYSVPDFWLALVVLILFAYRLPLFPPGGMTDSVMYEYLSPGAKLLDRIKHLVLPVPVSY